MYTSFTEQKQSTYIHMYVYVHIFSLQNTVTVKRVWTFVLLNVGNTFLSNQI